MEPAQQVTQETDVKVASPVEGQQTPEVVEKKDSPEELKAKRFAELSKKEQRILRKQIEMNRQLKEREESLTKRESEIKESVRRELMELAKKNPTEAIKQLGTDYKTLTDHILSDGKLTPEIVRQDAMSEVEKLRQELAETKMSLQEREQKRIEDENQRILQNFSASIVETVKNNPDKLPLVNIFDGSEVIFEIIQRRWQETKGQHLMTQMEAAELLERDLDGYIEKALQTPKYASRLNSQSQTGDKKPQSLNKPKTITNELTPSSPSFMPAKAENDRIKRALEKLNGG